MPDLEKVEAERTDYIAEAITEAFGERCLDFAEGCACCEAWKQYDELSRLREAATWLDQRLATMRQIIGDAIDASPPGETAIQFIERLTDCLEEGADRLSEEKGR